MTEANPMLQAFDIPRRDLAQVGIFGGTGLYHLLENAREAQVATPYGPPSDHVMLGEIGGGEGAFLPRPRHGHPIPPQKANYRANVWALASLGVTRIIGPTACGSLKPEVKPSDCVIC